MNYFDDPNSKHFSFESFADGLDENTFGVINFKGYEAISKVYDFEIMLVSSKKDLDLEDLLQAQAVFTIHRGENDNVLFNGILAEFDQLHEVNDVIFYRARLVPKLWWLSLTHHNQVFLDQSVPDIVEDALRDGGLETADFDIGALSGYEENAYVCQYDESHFNFVSRILERQGIYYYFVQEDDGEILTLTDTRFSHDALKEGAELFYNPASGLEGKHLGEAIGSFTCRQKQLPAEIILKDYNYERPSLDITSRAEVDPVGRGISYLYGEYFATPEEGERLAGIRAEELLCKKQEFFGESTVPYIMPGFTFNLNNHYREDFNQEYLILEVTHEGNQSHLMSGGITTDSGKSQNQAIYHNSFKAIPNETQYRPDRVTEKPKISGTIHAKIDSEVDSEYAQIDEQGRYHVKLPFDINDEHMDGKGSAPIRMMQSYAGKNRGMQFPLAKGTEVLLTFIEGNPDRPVIAGAVSNPETQGPVNADNQSESVIQTGGNNRIRMEDKAGSERMVFESPASSSWIRVGSRNDPITLNGPDPLFVDINNTTWTEPGAVTTVPDDVTDTSAVANPYTVVRTDSSGTVLADDAAVVANAGVYTYTYSSANQSTPNTTDTATRQVIVGDHDQSGALQDPTNLLNQDASGLRFTTAGVLWHQAKSYFGEFFGGAPVPDQTSHRQASGGGLATSDPTQSDPNQIGNLLANFGTSDATATPAVEFSYSPTNLLPYYADSSGNRTAITMDTALSSAHIKVSSMDTFNTQEGNIYDFGGYWNYNLGNSYEENHMLQDDTVELNKDSIDGDLLDVGGPHWSSINWPSMSNKSDSIGAMANYSGNSLDASDTTLPGTYDNSGGEACMWVTKSFGNSYEYTDGTQISVSKGHTLDVSHGGSTHIEVKYNSAGDATYWSKSAAGITDEKKWVKSGNLIYEGTTTNGIDGDGTFMRQTERHFDRNTGDVCEYSSVQGTGMGKVAFNFDYSNTTSAAFTFGLNVSSQTHSSLVIENNNFISGKVCNTNYVGMDISISSFAGMKLDISGCAGMIFESKNGKWELNFPGCEIEGETNKIDTKANHIETLANSINAMNANIAASTTDIECIAAVKLTS